ncbi:MAG: hypothetical protein O3A10_14970 [Chloroflexi bacterium]|nr:hypothetical protein [Chloroflexota bacterium]MDA1147994.1 hypothetical protein [Chloroflexota bacterium]
MVKGGDPPATEDGASSGHVVPGQWRRGVRRSTREIIPFRHNEPADDLDLPG